MNSFHSQMKMKIVGLSQMGGGDWELGRVSGKGTTKAGMVFLILSDSQLCFHLGRSCSLWRRAVIIYNECRNQKIFLSNVLRFTVQCGLTPWLLSP